ncbi:MAG TPA: hypothetical protein VF177_13295 [Anaerolineae bacterium]
MSYGNFTTPTTQSPNWKTRWLLWPGQAGRRLQNSILHRIMRHRSWFADHFQKSQYDDLLERLGKFKTGKSCLYVERLEDVNLDVLRELVRQSAEHVAATNA